LSECGPPDLPRIPTLFQPFVGRVSQPDAVLSSISRRS
jgi:hypothetical protein